MRLWPFGRRRRAQTEISEARARASLEIQRLKIDVAKQVAAEDPRTAAALLWGGARGAAQTLGPREPSIAEKYLEHKLLRDADEDGFDRILKVRQMIREEREEMDGEYDHSGALTAAVERFGPTVLAGLASMLNPAGYQAAMFAAQQQQAAAAAAAAGQQLPPPPGGTQVAMPSQSGAVAPAAPELGEDDDHDAGRTTVQNGDAVIPFPLRASTVLANLDAMPPAVFARWILEQPVLGSQMAALAQQSDDEIWKSLEVASANPLAGEFQAVFAWLRAHPQQAEAIVEAMRVMTIKLDDADDVAI